MDIPRIFESCAETFLSFVLRDMRHDIIDLRHTGLLLTITGDLIAFQIA